MSFISEIRNYKKKINEFDSKVGYNNWHENENLNKVRSKLVDLLNLLEDTDINGYSHIFDLEVERIYDSPLHVYSIHKLNNNWVLDITDPFDDENYVLELEYFDVMVLTTLYIYLCDEFDQQVDKECQDLHDYISDYKKYEIFFFNTYSKHLYNLLNSLLNKLSKKVGHREESGYYIKIGRLSKSGQLKHPENYFLIEIYGNENNWNLYFSDDSGAELETWGTDFLVRLYYTLLEDFSIYLSKSSFKKMNEMYSKPPETRLNYLKNFNHINKDQEGGMEIFGPRSNNEIQRMNDEIFDNGDEEVEEIENSDHELSTDVEDFEYPGSDNEEDFDGLVINSDEEKIQRDHSWPYGFGSSPSPTYKMSGGIQSKTGSPILTFEQYINEEFNWKGVSIKGKKLDSLFLDKVVTKLPKGSKILDVGYGDGSEMEYLSSKQFDVYGTEIREDYKDNLKNSKHITHDMREPFPFETNYFDFVYCRLSLHYFEEDEIVNIMKEIKRISNKYFAFTCKTSDGGYKSGKKFYSLEKWEEMCEKSGFNVYFSQNKSGKLYGEDSTWVEVYCN